MTFAKWILGAALAAALAGGAQAQTYPARQELSRADLTRHTGLSRSTTKDLVEELVERGLVEESPAPSVSQVGRPSPIVRPSNRVLAIAVTPEVDAVTVGVVSLGGSWEGASLRPAELFG